MNLQLNLSEISKKSEIPPKTRTMKKKSLLLQRVEKLGVGHSFVVQDAEIKAIAPTIYATAKRAGVKVMLRQVDNGVYVRRTEAQPSKSRKAA